MSALPRVSPLVRRYALIAAGALALPIASAHAQTGTRPALNIDGNPTIDRDRLDRQNPLLPPPSPTRTPVQPPVSVARPTAAAAAAGTLRGVRVEGSSIDPKRLAGAARAFAGAPITRETLQKLANAITAIYADSEIAFYSVSIPSQQMSEGVVKVQVVEGRIAHYKLTKHTRSTPTRLIDAQVRPLLADKPTHKPRLERTLNLLRDIPGQTIKADVLRTGRPDELDLALDVTRKQVEVTLNVNNRGVVNVTSGVQAQLGIAFNGILREGDSTRLTGSAPFQPSRYQFYSASHVTPLGAAGATLTLSGAYVRTRTREPEVLGEAKQFGIAVAHPVIRSNSRNLSVTASLDGANSDNYFLDTAFGGFHTRTLRAGASWSVMGKADGYAVSASLSQGLPALGAQAASGYSEKSYRKANVQLVALKQVGKRVTVKAGVRGQYTRDRLPTTERFALGGEGAGLAFRYGILTGDAAASGDIELSWRAVGSPSGGRGLTAFAFVDGSTARSYARPAYNLASRNYSLASAGGGIRVAPLKGWSATAQLAIPVNSPERDYGRKARLFFSVTRSV